MRSLYTSVVVTGVLIVVLAVVLFCFGLAFCVFVCFVLFCFGLVWGFVVVRFSVCEWGEGLLFLIGFCFILAFVFVFCSCCWWWWWW